MSAVESTHPTPDRLAAFSAGNLNEAESSVIERHLDQCGSCCTLLGSRHSDEILLWLLREGDVDTASPVNIVSTLAAPPAPAAATVDSPAPAGVAVSLRVPPELANHPRYRIVEMLGRGGMGCVFKAEHRLMHRAVALKVINPQFVLESDAVERFHREIQAAARLSHPNIVTAYDAEEAGDAHFFVMEFVEGQDLAEVVRQRGRLRVAQACEYVRQAALGLAHAHERGMIHRDIKPQNMMLMADGKVKLLDFGLASFASEAAERNGLTAAGCLMGTPDYLAPEQARDAHSADIRADIYSLGCTLYYLLAGQVPFPGGSTFQKVMAHTERQPQPLGDFRDDVPSELAQVIAKMMAKAPADRYQTPSEAAEALAPFTRTASVVVTAAPEPADAGRSQRRWLIGAAAAAAAFLLLGVIYIVTDDGRLVIES
ncbi:MAG: serine/threonine protein kinase, partial [Planctomycetes bacterium]|nr:serine/threonine protein kinase [Planctomycetota bacterium]